MPKLSDYLDTYRRMSAKASDIARNLSFAGIALIWIFKMDTSDGPKVPKALLLPAALLASALLFDLCQYITATVVWGFFYGCHEKLNYRKHGDKALSEDPEIDHPTYLPWFQKSFFILKLVCVLLSYCLLAIFLYQQWYCI